VPQPCVTSAAVEDNLLPGGFVRGRALTASPSLLMLDEPSLGLSPLLAKEIIAVVASLRDRGLAVLLVEQNARAALHIADHVYVLERPAI
jgi:branched-chain amino acid transport system ATP-binding protein